MKWWSNNYYIPLSPFNFGRVKFPLFVVLQLLLLAVISDPHWTTKHYKQHNKNDPKTQTMVSIWFSLLLFLCSTTRLLLIFFCTVANNKNREDHFCRRLFISSSWKHVFVHFLRILIDDHLIAPTHSHADINDNVHSELLFAEIIQDLAKL